MRSNDFVLWGCNCASPQIEKRTLDFHTPWENYWRIENRWPFLGIRHKPAVDINPSYGQVKRLSCISLPSRWKTCLSARNKLCEMKELMLLLCMKNNTYIDGVPFLFTSVYYYKSWPLFSNLHALLSISLWRPPKIHVPQENLDFS